MRARDPTIAPSLPGALVSHNDDLSRDYVPRDCGLDCRNSLQMEQQHRRNYLCLEQRHRHGRIHLRDDGYRRGPDMDHRPSIVSSARSTAAFRPTAAFAIFPERTWRISALRQLKKAMRRLSTT